MDFLKKFIFWSLRNKINLFFSLIFIKRKLIRILKFKTKKKIYQEKLKSESICQRNYIIKENFYKGNKINNIYDASKMEFCNYSTKNDSLNFNKLAGAADLELIYNICNHIKPKIIVETGVAFGWSSSVFLNYIYNQSINTKLISFDMPYILSKNDNYIGKVVCEKFKKKWTLIKGVDYLSIKRNLHLMTNIDLFHYDSDKSYEGMIKIFNTVYPLIKENGFMIVDDINDNMAFHKFCDFFLVKPIIVKLNNKYIGIIKK